MSANNLAQPSQTQQQAEYNSGAGEHIVGGKNDHRSGDFTGDGKTGETEGGNKNATIRGTQKGESNDTLDDVISKYLMDVGSKDNAHGIVANTMGEDVYHPYSYLYPNGGVESYCEPGGNPNFVAIPGRSNFVVSRMDEATITVGNHSNNTGTVQIGEPSGEQMLHPHEDALASENSNFNYIDIVNSMGGNYEPNGAVAQIFNYQSEEEFVHEGNAYDEDGCSETNSEMKNPPAQTTPKRRTYPQNMDTCGPARKMRKGVNSSYPMEETHNNNEKNNFKERKYNLYRNNPHWKATEENPLYQRERPGLYKGAFKKWEGNQINSRQGKKAGGGQDERYNVVDKKLFLSKWDKVDEENNNHHDGPRGEACYDDSRGIYLGRGGSSQFTRERASQFGRGRPSQSVRGGPSQFTRGRASQYGRGRPTQYGRGRPSHVDRGGRSNHCEYGRFRQQNHDRSSQYDPDRLNPYGKDPMGQYHPDRSNKYDTGRMNLYGHNGPNHHGYDQSSLHDPDKSERYEYDHGRSSQCDHDGMNKYELDRLSKYDADKSSQYGSNRSTQDDFDRLSKYSTDQLNQYAYNRPSQYNPNRRNQYSRDGAIECQGGQYSRGHRNEPEEKGDTYLGQKYKCNIFNEECYIIECKCYGSEEMEVPGPLSTMEDLW